MGSRFSREPRGGPVVGGGVGALVLVLVAAAAGWAGAAGAQTVTTPLVSSAGPFTVAEGSVKVAQMTASGFSEDAEDLYWSVLTGAGSGADGDKFKLRLDNVLEFVEPPDFEQPADADADNVYVVTVKVSNGADTDPVEATADISVTVSDVGFTAFDVSTLSVDFDENRHLRVATLDAGDPVVEWSLSGPDAGWFRIAGGALRFRSQEAGGPPDFESPGDSGADNVYVVTVAAEEDSTDADTTDASSVAVSVTILNVDEPGTIKLLPDSVPAIGEALTASLGDPDGGVADIEWVWERSVGRSAWEVIDAATGSTYTPAAADSEDYLRVTATYTDALAAAKTARAVASSPPLGELLSSLSVATSSTRKMYPAFDPEVLHYAVGCDSEVTLSLSAASSDARVSVDGIQQPASTAEVTVSGLHDGVNVADRNHSGPDASDIEIVLSDAGGSSTTYVVHCIHDDYPEITPIQNPSSGGIIEDLILLHLQPTLEAGVYPSIVDTNGVPRFHRHTPGNGPFFRVFQIDGRYRYAWAQANPGTENKWIILNEYFTVLDNKVTTASPLVKTNAHDFRILDNGNYLLMSYEPAYLDLRFMETLIPDISNPAHVLTDDSVVQIITPSKPNGTAVFTWNSFDQMDVRDCLSHRFPKDYAHGNSLQYWEPEGRDQDWVVVSLRGCSAVAVIDADTAETVARIGRTNLSADEWAAAGKGDPPMLVLDDPHGEFCGQHSAWMLPHEHLVLFDNGNSCVSDARTGETVRNSNRPDRFSRVVEYALDLDNGEAVFVRHHSLHGAENREGRSSGHVDVLDNGDWLIGWGRASHDTDPETAWGPDEAVTQVDPDTGEEKFALQISEPDGLLLDVDGDGDTEREQMRVRPVPVSPVALARDRLALQAGFAAASEHTAEFFNSAQARPTVVVSFNQPVVDFDETTASIAVSGGSLESVAPHVVAGEPAHSYLLTLAPDGEAAITVSLVASQACDAGGVCTADGSTLPQAPPAHRVRFSSPPAVDADSLAFEVDENTTAVGRLSATDNDTAASGLTWALASEVTGADDAKFTLNSSGVLSLRAGKDFEAPDDADGDGTYEVMVQVSDGDSTVSALVDVTLAGVDEAPVVSGPLVVSYDENDTAEVGFYGAVDPEGEPVEWSLSGLDAGDFELAGGSLTFKTPPDFEARGGSAGGGNTYAVTVEASDGDLEGSLVVRVSVNDVDEAPVVSGPSSVSVSVDEGTVAVESFNARDPEGDGVEWLLSGLDGGDFEIVGGSLRFGSPPDFEARGGSAGGGNTYVVTVEASDGDLTGSVGVEVTVVNVDEPGAVSLGSVQPQAGSALQASVTDPDGIVGSVSWVWERSANRNSWSALSGAASAAYTPKAGDVGMWLRATASYNDGQGSSKSASAVSTNTVRAAPVVNRRPEFPATETGLRAVAENTPAGRSIGAPVAATDPDAGDRLTYTLAGADADRFDLDEQTGRLRTKAALDHEATPSLSVVVTATDPGLLAVTVTVTVTVTDVDEAPVLAGPGVIRYDENDTAAVGSFTATDPDGDPVEWSLSGSDRRAFTIDAMGQLSATGQLSFVAPPDHEAKSLYRVTVGAADDARNTAHLEVTVNIDDINEPPEVSGNATPGFRHLGTATVARYTARDPERRPIQWSLSGPDREDLSIDSGGVLRFVAPPDIDRPDDADTDNTYELTIEAYDGHSTGTLTVAVTVTLTGPRPPVITTGGGGGGGPAPAAEVEISGAAFAAPRTQTTFSVAGAAGFETLTWAVTGPGGFSASGDGERFSFSPPAGGEYTVTVTATDRGGETLTATVTLAVLGDIAGSLFADEIVWLAQEGITTGCGDGTNFCPNRPVTRAEMATFLTRALGLESPPQPAGFADVDPDSVHAPSIEALHAASITTGCGDGTNFCPNRPVTRAEMATFLTRALGLESPPQPAGFADVDPDSVHAPSIEALHAASITTGCGDGTNYCPNRPVTRAQMAAFLHRARDLIATAHNTNSN